MEIIGKTTGEHGFIVWHDDGTFSLTVYGERVGLAKDLFGKPRTEYKRSGLEVTFCPLPRDRESINKAGGLIKEDGPNPARVMSLPRKPRSKSRIPQK